MVLAQLVESAFSLSNIKESPTEVVLSKMVKGGVQPKLKIKFLTLHLSESVQRVVLNMIIKVNNFWKFLGNCVRGIRARKCVPGYMELKQVKC